MSNRVANPFRLIAKTVRFFRALTQVEVFAGLALAATALVLYFEDDLFASRLTITPASIRSEQEVFSYADSLSGGTSAGQVVARQKLSFACSLTLAAANPYCGYGFAMNGRREQGIDLSKYETIRISMDRTAPTRLARIYLKNFNPRYSRLGVYETEKYNYANVAVSNGPQTIEVPLGDFEVVDWWKNTSKLPADLTKRELTNVVAIDIQEGQDSQPGEYRTAIHKIEFERRILASNHLHSALAVAWFLLFGALLWHHRLQSARALRAEAAQLRWTSEHDALTGLPNRRAFQTRLQAATLRAMADGRSLALFVIDLDHFKHINDSLGHMAGDDLLKCMAERFQSSLRENDFVGRLGGDEFAVILEGVDGPEGALRRGNEVLARLLPPALVAGRMVRPGASIGGALFPRDGENADDLFRAADTALYALKGDGRGGTKLFDSKMLEDAERSASELRTAKAAIVGETVVPHFQPMVDLSTQAIVAFEALLRNKHRTGFRLPASLQGAFSDYELASGMGNLMQRGVARSVASWLNKGFHPCPVAINASPAEFLRDDYSERLIGILREHDVPASLITVEVTEQVFMGRSTDYVSRALNVLKVEGVHISLDDFGTGYSSLAHLRDLPVDTVKIDRTFIDQIETNPEVAAIVAAVVSLTKSLKLSVVAEGVERPAQAELLRVLGCNVGQGFLFGGAATFDEATTLLSQQRLAA